ncbi:MAG TPA: hypothetical protein VMU78_06545 [Methylocella sp.]|nr:hypothetical protein [Methylocella sp.]
MSLYATKIKDLSPASDPCHVEAYMRLAHGTLHHLRPEQFREKAALAVASVTEGGIETAEKLAQSYGL